MKGISAVIATILMLMITIALAGTAYMYISGVFTSKTRTISMVDMAVCGGTTGTAVIRNDGSDTITAADQTLVSISETCTEPTLGDITAGSTRTYTFTSCTAGSTNKYKLIGPSNGVEIQFKC